MTTASCLISANTVFIISFWLLGSGALFLIGLCWHALQSRAVLALQAERLALYAAGRTIIDFLDKDLAPSLPESVWTTTYKARFLFNDRADAFFEELRAHVPVALAEETKIHLHVAHAFVAQGRALQAKPSAPPSPDTEALRCELERLTAPFLTASLCDREAWLRPIQNWPSKLRRMLRNLKRRAVQKYGREKKRQRQIRDAEYFGNL